MRFGELFLEEVFHDRTVTRSVNQLRSALFHLLTLGVLAIVSVVDPGIADGVQRMVVRLGVVLIVLGIAYGICMLVLIQVRDRRRAAQISEEVAPPPRPCAGPPDGRPDEVKCSPDGRRQGPRRSPE